MEKPELNEVLKKYEAKSGNELIPEKTYLVEVFDNKMNIIKKKQKFKEIVEKTVMFYDNAIPSKCNGYMFDAARFYRLPTELLVEKSSYQTKLCALRPDTPFQSRPGSRQQMSCVKKPLPSQSQVQRPRTIQVFRIQFS
jgi:hypothetical protein